MHPDPDYEEVVTFLVKQADSIGLDWRRHELSPGKPILVISWPGLEPGLPSVMLNSHMDVVPVFPEHWTHPLLRPHGRGAQHLREGDAGHEVCGDHASGDTVILVGGIEQ